MKKNDVIWYIDLSAAVLFILLGVTGGINWLFLPHGTGPGTIKTIRHFLVDVHQWTALFFMTCIGLHVVLHWGYVKMNLKKRFGID